MTTWFDREQWGARPPKLVRQLTGFTSGWFIHWLGEPAAAGLPDDQVLRNTQRYHMDSKAWVDIAYSFAVGRQHPDRVYELRGWGIAGGHTEGHNSQSMAIVFLLGTGERPTDTMLDTARAILAEGERRGYSAKIVRPHNDVRSTACPGPDLTNWVNAGRFTAKETTVPPTETDPGARIQRAINANGLQPPLKVDGQCGPATANGLENVLAYLAGRIDKLATTNVDLAGHNVTLASERDTAVANREAAEAEAAALRKQLQEGSGRTAVLSIVQGLRATLNEAEAKLQGLA